MDEAGEPLAAAMAATIAAITEPSTPPAFTLAAAGAAWARLATMVVDFFGLRTNMNLKNPTMATNDNRHRNTVLMPMITMVHMNDTVSMGPSLYRSVAVLLGRAGFPFAKEHGQG